MKSCIVILIISLCFLIKAKADLPASDKEAMKCKVLSRSLKFGVMSKCENYDTECYLQDAGGSMSSRMHCFKKNSFK